ncbi:MAG: hypothetical protein OSJ70_08715 [Bacilli bacterium]|nr:hypothetical protein [Bacilli bacterium]
MSIYLLKRDDRVKDIEYMEYDLDGYKFNPKQKENAPYINVRTVTIYNHKMINYLLTRKFQKKFERLSQIILQFLYQDEEDCDEGDFMILLDEVARLRSVVEIQYKKELEMEEYRDYIDKLAFLDNQVRQKLAMISYRNKLNYEVEKGRSL